MITRFIRVCMVSALLGTAVMPGQGEEIASQTSPGTATPLSRNWTLQDCIDYALANNIQLRQNLLQVEQSDVNLLGYKAQLFPSLNFSTNHNLSWRPWSESYVDIQDGTMSMTQSTVNYNGTYGVAANWTVWDGGRNRKNIELGRLNREQAELEAATTAKSIQEQIAQLYVQILYQTEAVKVNRMIAESSVVQVERAGQMFEVGNMSRAELAQVEAQLSQDMYNVTAAGTQLEQYKLQLKQLLELVQVEEFDVAIPEISDDSVLGLLPAKDDVYMAAAGQRPEILAMEAGISVADLNIDIARRGYYPTLGVSAGVNTSTASGMKKGFDDQLKSNLSTSVGVSISVPIFDNRRNKTNVETARIDRENADLRLEAARRDLYSTIEGFWLNARNAQQQYLAAKANVAAMNESYSLVDEQFAVGLKDVVDLITAKNNLVQAEQQMLQSKYTALLNLAMLRFYAGDNLSL